MSRVKICGLSRIEDVDAVNRALPDYIGFVFAPSRRRVNIKTAAILKEKLDPRIKAVGVFVNEPLQTVTEIHKNAIIEMVQLHGSENDEYIRRIKESCACRIIKAVSIGDALPSLSVEPDYFLFDTLSKQRGGVGKTFNWNILKGYSGLPYFLAGGLSIENVSRAIGLLTPYCVDVSSGGETNGVKDADKIIKFINLARGQR
jgi:phosphoribosylanthranilate isomerase